MESKKPVGRPLKYPQSGPQTLAHRASSYRARIDQEIYNRNHDRWSKNACLRVLKLEKFPKEMKLLAVDRLHKIISSSS